MAENNIAGTVYESLSAATDSIAKTMEQSAAITAEIRSGKYSREELEKTYYPKSTELTLKIRHDAEDAIRDAHRLVAEYRAECEARNNTLDSSMINDDAKLLQAGVNLTEKDIDDLLERNTDNPTMTQIIKRFAKEHKIRISGRHIDRLQEENRMCDDVDFVISMYQKWIRHPKGKEMLDKFFSFE